MADQNKLGPTFDPGLTLKFNGEIKQTINPDGSFNVRRRAVPLSARHPYLFLVDTSWTRFLICLLLAFLAINTLFAFIYMSLGIDHLVGWNVNTGVGPFLSALFFSVHTLTTTGYGNVYPRGIMANTVAGIEAMLGLLSFALATGLLFARFSKPSAKILFSEKMVVAPYQGITALEFRVANQRSNTLMEVQATVLLMTVERCDGELQRRFVNLSLERPSVYFFPLTWTVVHPITPDSPIYGKTAEDLAAMEAEFLVLVKAFDDTFSQVVNTRYSYRYDQIVWGARFSPAFFVDPAGYMVLELDRVNDLKTATLPASPPPAVPDKG